jgi:hypothetical protein
MTPRTRKASEHAATGTVARLSFTEGATPVAFAGTQWPNMPLATSFRHDFAYRSPRSDGPAIADQSIVPR